MKYGTIKNRLKSNAALKTILKVCRGCVFPFTQEYRRWRSDRGEGRLLYMSEIDHGNLGDHAIVYAQQQMLSELEKTHTTYHFKRKYCLAALEKIADRIRSSDMVFIPGGGWIGTLWRESGQLFTTMLEQLGKAHIMVFPQTITFEDTPYGKQQKERLYQAIATCAGLDLCVRDSASYNFLLKEMPPQSTHVRYHLYPDMVLMLCPALHPPRQKKILVVLRQDKEKSEEGALQAELLHRLEEEGYDLEITDTVLPNHVQPTGRKAALEKKWLDFAQAALVVTDRLHGMIFSVINQTPCIAFDNSNHKVRGVYQQWLRECPLVYFVSSQEEAENLILTDFLENKENPEVQARWNEQFTEMKSLVKSMGD